MSNQTYFFYPSEWELKVLHKIVRLLSGSNNQSFYGA